MANGKGKEGIIGGRGLISVTFRHVLRMENMNDFSDNDLRKTSLSIVFPKRGENENNITTARCFL